MAEEYLDLEIKKSGPAITKCDNARKTDDDN